MKSYSLTNMFIFMQMRQALIICVILEFGACFKALTTNQKNNQLSIYLQKQYSKQSMLFWYFLKNC